MTVHSALAAVPATVPTNGASWVGRNWLPSAGEKPSPSMSKYSLVEAGARKKFRNRVAPEMLMTVASALAADGMAATVPPASRVRTSAVLVVRFMDRFSLLLRGVDPGRHAPPGEQVVGVPTSTPESDAAPFGAALGNQLGWLTSGLTRALPVRL